MEKKYKFLLYMGIFALIIIIWFCWNPPKYNYVPGIYSLSGEINIDGIIYREINEETYEVIFDKMEEQGVKSFEYVTIGRIDYIYVDKIWKYKIYGNKSSENRILLKGEEDYAFNDANYPEIYFCRQDILQLLDMDSE